jgi:hypothetical protein
MSLSIVVPSQGDSTLQVLLRVLAQLRSGIEAELEVLVAWDARTPEHHRREFEQAWPQVRFFKAVSSGANAARNIGIEKAQFEWIWLLDDDVVPVHPIELGFWKAQKSVHHIWGGEYWSPPQSSRAMRSANCLARMWRRSASHPQREALLGGSLSFSRQVWREVGRFSEVWDYGGTETEWLFRVWRAGFESTRHEQLDVWHTGRARSWAQHFRAFWRQGFGKSRMPSSLPGISERARLLWPMRPRTTDEFLDQLGAAVLWTAALAGTLMGRMATRTSKSLSARRSTGVS